MRFAAVRLLTKIRSLPACRSGQVAIIFAFAATMLFIAIGMGIDLWRAYAVKARLQSAVDAAALALASTDRTQYTNPQDPFLVSRVQAYVSTNYPTAALGTPGVPVLSYGGTNLNTIIVTDSATIPTTFMNIVGVNSLSVSATGQAQAAWSNIDFYLLLDRLALDGDGRDDSRHQHVGRRHAAAMRLPAIRRQQPELRLRLRLP